MADQPNREKPDQQAEPTAEKPKSGKPALWRRLLSPKWIAAIVVASIVVHGTALAYFRLANHSPPAASSPEVSLGTFRFEAPKNEVGPVASAEFSLHIALLEQVDLAAHQQLETHRFRVQQDIEELLRKAHGGDFDDPSLGELKRQLQEQINETLGMRVIADVIITDLRLQHTGRDLGLVTDRSESVPWVEKPSG